MQHKIFFQAEVIAGSQFLHLDQVVFTAAQIERPGAHPFELAAALLMASLIISNTPN